jgi:hypothetical protein
MEMKLGDLTRATKHVNMIRRFIIDIFFVGGFTEHLTPARFRQASCERFCWQGITICDILCLHHPLLAAYFPLIFRLIFSKSIPSGITNRHLPLLRLSQTAPMVRFSSASA